jgi:hypothetical protein
MKSYNVIMYEPNGSNFVEYDIIPYFVDCYKKSRKNKRKPSKSYIEHMKEKNIEIPEHNYPVTREEFKEFIKRWGMYRFWSRCEYEVILSAWPPTKDMSEAKKIDIWSQINMNIDLITEILMGECEKVASKTRKKKEQLKSEENDKG